MEKRSRGPVTWATARDLSEDELVQVVGGLILSCPGVGTLYVAEPNDLIRFDPA